MKKVMLILLSLVFVTVGFAGTSFALPSDLNLDNYYHPNDSNASQINKDVLGASPPFNFYGYRWMGSTLEIYTNWNEGLDGKNLGAYLGDVFFYDGDPSTTDGIFAALALRDHFLPQEGDGIEQGNVFTPYEYRFSGDYFGDLDPIKYGDNEHVTGIYTPNGIVTADVGFANVEVFYTEVEPGEFKISADFGGLVADDFDFDQIMVRLSQTCGNDVMASVPEPATLLLLGTGLIGLAGFGRRKFKNR